MLAGMGSWPCFDNSIVQLLFKSWDWAGWGGGGGDPSTRRCYGSPPRWLLVLAPRLGRGPRRSVHADMPPRPGGGGWRESRGRAP